MTGKIAPKTPVIWRALSLYDAERQRILCMLQILFGDGPFVVVETASVPKEDQKEKGKQYLTLADMNGEILMLGNETMRFSDFWFRKIRILIYAPGRSEKKTPEQVGPA